MANVTSIDTLIKKLNALRRASEHPEFDDAIEALFENDLDADNGHLDFLDQEVVLAYVAHRHYIDVIHLGSVLGSVLVLRHDDGVLCDEWIEKEWREIKI